MVQMNTRASTIVCVLAKAPVPGKVKTRLAARIGDVRAAGLARAFLADTWNMVSNANWAKAVLATTDGSACDFGLPGNLEIWPQGEGDLGVRLERVMRRGLRDADMVIAIGADSPGLPERILVQARNELRTADAVLGPADDGGFYLLGLRRCPERLFHELPWSQTTTLAATQARLAQNEMSVAFLEPWFDVDEPSDLDRLRDAVECGTLHAPVTGRFLATVPRGAVSCG